MARLVLPKSNSSVQTQPVINAQVLQQPDPQPVQKPMNMEQQLRAAIENDFVTRQAQQEEEKARIKDMLAQKQQVDLSPLMGLVSTIQGNDNAMRAYKAPQGNGEEVAAAMKNLAAGQRGLTQDRIADLKTMLENKQSANTSARLAVQNDRMDRNEHMQIVRAIKNDPVAKQRLTQFQNLGNSLALIDKSEKLTPQQIHEFQQSIRSNLGIKGTSGVGEREATFLDSLGLRAEAFQQFLTGDPAEISKNDKIVNHIRDLARVERSQINSQFQDELDTASEGRASLYARRADLSKDLEKLLKASSKRVNIGNDNIAYGGNISTPNLMSPVPNQGGTAVARQGAVKPSDALAKQVAELEAQIAAEKAARAKGVK